MPEYFEGEGIESRVIHALKKRVQIPESPPVDIEIEVRVGGKVVTIDIQAVFDAAMASVREQIRSRNK